MSKKRDPRQARAGARTDGKRGAGVPFGRRIAYRQYLWRPAAGRSRTVNVEIGTPVQVERAWACPLRVSGLPTTFDHAIYGIDSVQALELALVMSGKLLAGSPQFRAGQIEQFGKPVTEPSALFLPLPMSSLQMAQENLQRYLERQRKRGWANEEWRRNLLTMMREIAGDLATLAAHLPIEPSKKNRSSKYNPERR